MFLFDQISGRLWHRDSSTAEWLCFGAGYSGNSGGLLNPAWQDIKNHGPIPAGEYKLTLFNWPSRGPIVFSLKPDPTNGRSGFFLHWDTAAHDFTASDGCIVCRDLAVFQFIQKKVTAGDNELEVVAQPLSPPYQFRKFGASSLDPGKPAHPKGEL